MRLQWTFAFVWFQLIVAAIFFCMGMFPIKNISGNQSSIDDLPVYIGKTRIEPAEIYKKQVDKLVIMVVDAMRYDFIINDDNLMPSLTSLLQSSKKCITKAKVEAPTVTMPRIKALMSGSIPGYSDVIMNFMAEETLMDNLLFQAKNKGLRSIFYGDKTWLDLFPNEFVRSEGTTSFVVSDYEEVDTNVTRNLVEELERTDWDLMILHYLGLDHIGHLEGPFSPLVKPKLLEMDKVISLIYDFILKMSHKSEKVVLLICSDHGMKDTGGHGGSSDPEVFVPYIFLNYDCNTELRKSTINQIDITPLLSILLGVPIPSDSAGMLHYSMLSEVDLMTALYLIHYNTIHLKQIFTHYDTNSDLLKTFKSAEQLLEDMIKSDNFSCYHKLLESYHSAQEGMSSFIIKKSIEYRYSIIWLAMCLLAQIIIFVLTKCYYNCDSCRFFWFTISYGSLMASFYFNEAEGHYPIYSYDLVFILVTINLFFLVPERISIDIPEVPRDTNLYFLIIIIVYMASLASTSFIEEENSFWYFIFSTFLFFKVPSNAIFNITVLIVHCILRNLNNIGVKDLNSPSIGDWLQHESNYLWQLTFYIVALIFISAWCYVYVVKISGISSLMKKIMTLSFCVKFVILLLIKASYGVIKLPFLQGFRFSDLMLTNNILWISFCIQVAAFLLSSYYTAANDPHFYSRHRYFMIHFVDSMLLLTIISLIFVLKPHNLILIPFMLMSAKYINKVSGGDPFQFTFYHFALGFLCFFYQGNSNNLATVDISVGFFGQENPGILLSGLLIYINTHASQILSTVLLIHSLYTEDRLMFQQLDVFRSVTLLSAYYLFFYCCIILLQRHHLFIWSVFSPKLLYVVSSVVLQFFLLLCVVLVELLNSYTYNEVDYLPLLYAY